MIVGCLHYSLLTDQSAIRTDIRLLPACRRKSPAIARWAEDAPSVVAAPVVAAIRAEERIPRLSGGQGQTRRSLLTLFTVKTLGHV